MTDLYTIVSPKKEIEHLSRIRPFPKYDKLFQARPGHELPIIARTGTQLTGIKAIWGIEHRGKYITSIDVSKILLRKPFNLWFRKYRCAIPANCFYASREEGKVHLIRVLKQRTFMIGGVCLPPSETGSKHQFALLTVESADILQRVTDSMPVIFGCHKTANWIEEETILKVMGICDRSGDHWFDYYKVHPRIIEPKWNEKDLLKPMGISFREWQEREEKLNALDIKDDRFNRNNSKGRR